MLPFRKKVSMGLGNWYVTTVVRQRRATGPDPSSSSCYAILRELLSTAYFDGLETKICICSFPFGGSAFDSVGWACSRLNRLWSCLENICPHVWTTLRIHYPATVGHHHIGNSAECIFGTGREKSSLSYEAAILIMPNICFLQTNFIEKARMGF